MNSSTRTAILLLLPIVFYQPTRADGLSRLFTTAQQRAALNAERDKPPPPPPPDETGNPPPPQKRPRYITFNGLIVRSQGPSTVWINGSNNLFQPDFRVELDQKADITVPIFLYNSKQTIQLKPGQTVNTLDGTIKDNFKQPSLNHE
ncbi:MAG TPA: hypothetical protein ENG03_08995 [Thioploca sp.]|nr:MAG: hypothetical protein DRR19_18265 [Gammaproteobacteria bacterium]HDN27213.1 hypothetical protein [Thioploca sp.]